MGMALDNINLPADTRLPFYALYEPTSAGTEHTVWLNCTNDSGSFSMENQKMMSEILIDTESN